MYDDGINDIEFPTPICPITEPHPKHLIPGTWREQCNGVEGPAVQHNATDEHPCTECGHLGRGNVGGCACVGCDDESSVKWIDPVLASYRAARLAFRPYRFTAPSKAAEESIACPECSATPGEKCRWPDGGTCVSRLNAYRMTTEERDAHSSAYWETVTEGLPRKPAWSIQASDPRRES
jgi:hypothetical protein